jgi:hypothetical protein
MLSTVLGYLMLKGGLLAVKGGPNPGPRHIPSSQLSRVALEGYSDPVSLPFEEFLSIYHDEPRRSRRQSHLFHGQGSQP